MGDQQTMTAEQRLRFEGEGFLHLPGVIPPDLMRRAREAFHAAAAAYEPVRQSSGAQGKASPVYDIPDILDRDDAFVDLVDLPAMMPILLEAVGPDIQLNHTHARVFLPGKTITAPWHSDLADVVGIDLPHSPHFLIKVHYYFEDLAPDQGCLAFLPGTHRLPADYPRPRIDPDRDSPALRKVVPRAGDAVLFNTHLLHMALDNTSGRARRSLIYAYSHFWVKHYANAVPAEVDRLATTPLRRQLFGVDRPGVPYFARRHDGDATADEHCSFRSASRAVVKRQFRATSATRIK